MTGETVRVAVEPVEDITRVAIGLILTLVRVELGLCVPKTLTGETEPPGKPISGDILALLVGGYDPPPPVCAKATAPNSVINKPRNEYILLFAFKKNTIELLNFSIKSPPNSSYIWEILEHPSNPYLLPNRIFSEYNL